MFSIGRHYVTQLASIRHMVWAVTVLVPGDTVLKMIVCAPKKVNVVEKWKSETLTTG